MEDSNAEMWKAYDFRGYLVTVIQKWRDPYGQRMVRIKTISEEEDLAEGMSEDLFLQESSLRRSAPPYLDDDDGAKGREG